MAVTRYMAAIRDLQAPNLAAAAGTQCLIASVYLLSLYEVSYAKELSPMFKSDVDSSLLIQMLNAGEANDMNCVMHLSGIIALMRHHSSDQPPPDAGIELLILGTDSSVETGPRSGGRPMYQQLGIARSPLHKLVSILPRVSGLFKKAGIILEPRSVRFESQLVTLKEEAISVRSELLASYSTQPSSNRPVTAARFTQPYSLLFPDSRPLVCDSLRADSYVDRK